ncbi:N-acetyl-1-D-myo-inositol-2-amino-2-deoxy-alpha-D-glucopyranoside deacetylase [Segniliparus rugosus]|uniref:N-acetyl-1-D-myo-inositol-2-amino-2-deoxy-alpha- D-glucopyranoside deacetylase n=1 Tax=Segniliparus rugosus TaxID=286804 RepID=UPI00058F9797|nr:N-acetyl-1-D-myo-inositol-2-amino-2-deoxy-alpha-D-glucopyranoside deacetylase [Segniliparus rugosus]
MGAALNDKGRARALFIFAHPDDETILCGGAMARLAAEGVEVSVLTCTLGEEGEVIAPALRELAADRADQLGGWRIAELRAALDRLGSPGRGSVIGQHFLGGAGRWRDSGMAAGRNTHQRAFVAGDFGEQSRAAAKTIRETRPHVVVTHDPGGGYGHRDHVHANRIAVEAVKIAAAEAHRELGPSWQIAKLYWAGVGRSMWKAEVEALAAQPIPEGFHVVDPDVAKPWQDDEVTTVFDIGEFRSAKLAALAEHATQITVHPELETFALSNKALNPVPGEEHFALAQQHRAPAPQRGGGHAREDHLLAGVVVV